MSGLGQSRPVRASNGSAHARYALIVLQNSFWGCVKNFLGSLMRSPGNYVGGHMIDPISNRDVFAKLFTSHGIAEYPFYRMRREILSSARF